MGAELYKNLSNYFIGHLTEVRSVRYGASNRWRRR